MTRRGNDGLERDQLLAAMLRIVKGEANSGSRRLSVKGVAEEAGLARTSLTHKHLDVKELVDLMKAALAFRDTTASAEVTRLREQVEDLTALNEVLAAQVAAAALAHGPTPMPWNLRSVPRPSNS